MTRMSAVLQLQNSVGNLEQPVESIPGFLKRIQIRALVKNLIISVHCICVIPKMLRIRIRSARCSLLRDEDFSCSLDVIYGDLGISQLQFLFSAELFSNFW
jgi:hypothetical protein